MPARAKGRQGKAPAPAPLSCRYGAGQEGGGTRGGTCTSRIGSNKRRGTASQKNERAEGKGRSCCRGNHSYDLALEWKQNTVSKTLNCLNTKHQVERAKAELALVRTEAAQAELKKIKEEAGRARKAVEEVERARNELAQLREMASAQVWPRYQLLKAYYLDARA